MRKRIMSDRNSGHAVPKAPPLPNPSPAGGEGLSGPPTSAVTEATTRASIPAPLAAPAGTEPQPASPRNSPLSPRGRGVGGEGEHATCSPPPLALTGLVGSHPLGALAAFGLLRWSAEIPALRGARLHWELQDDWIAVLTPPVALDADALCRVLLDAHAGAGGWPHLAGAGPTLRMPATDFRTRCRAATELARPAARFAADFAAGCGCDAVFRKQDETLTPTRFDMTSARQGLLKDNAIKLAKNLSLISRLH